MSYPPPPQPEPNNHTKTLIWVFVGIGVFILCLVAIVCLGPLGFFAWFTDRQLDEFDERSGFELVRLALRG